MLQSITLATKRPATLAWCLERCHPSHSSVLVCLLIDLVL